MPSDSHLLLQEVSSASQEAECSPHSLLRAEYFQIGRLLSSSPRQAWISVQLSQKELVISL